MSDPTVPLVHVHAVLRCRSAGAPTLHNEAAARWTLRHVAFNSGFEQHPAANETWVPPRDSDRPGYELNLEMGDGRFALRARPAQRRLDLDIQLGPRARHLRRNLPRLVAEFAAASVAEVLSLDIVDDGRAPRSDAGPANELLVLPA